MSEKNTAKNTEKKSTEKKTTEKKSQNDVVVSKELATVHKMAWTLDRCKKYARRYSSEVLWASGSPASYKSALAHGWREICLAEMQIAGGNGHVPRGAEKKAA